VGVPGIHTGEVHRGERCEAATILGELGSSEASAPLAKALLDKEVCVADAAAKALSILTPISVIQTLVQYLKEADSIERCFSHGLNDADFRRNTTTRISFERAQSEGYRAWKHVESIRDALLSIVKKHVCDLPEEQLHLLAGMVIEYGEKNLGVPDFETEPDIRRWGVDVSAIIEVARRELEARKGAIPVSPGN
jgi:hypothetical protein